MGSGWYLGNIYAGANAAARGNRDLKSSFFLSAWKEAGIPGMEEDIAWPKPPEASP
jgi:hypothetical protein